MDLEDNDYIQGLQLVLDSGFMDMDHFFDFKSHAINGLMKFGDKFDFALAGLLANSKIKDTIKIFTIWNSKCQEHSILWRAYQAKCRAENENR